MSVSFQEKKGRRARKLDEDRVFLAEIEKIALKEDAVRDKARLFFEISLFGPPTKEGWTLKFSPVRSSVRLCVAQ